MAQARAAIAEHNRITVQQLRDKNADEQAYTKALDKAQTASVPRTSSNSFSVQRSVHGDVVTGWAPNSWGCSFSLSGWCHAGIINMNRSGNLTDKVVYTANQNTDRAHGLRWETVAYWRDEFDQVAEMSVLGTTAVQSANAVLHMEQYFTTSQGPYSLATSKGANDKWYCSKVAWRAYADVTGKDIDGDAGYWVYPADIYSSPQTPIRWNFY